MNSLTHDFRSAAPYCRHLVDDALNRMRDAQSLHPFHNIYAALIRDMRDMHCLPFNETTDGPQTEDRGRINDMLFDKTMIAVQSASSGCRVDQALRDLRAFQSKIGARCTDDQRCALIDAVDIRTRDGMAETGPAGPYQEMWKGWRGNCLRMLGDRPMQDGPARVAQPALSVAA